MWGEIEMVWVIWEISKKIVLLWRKRWGALVRPHISDSSLTLKEMLGDESYFIKKMEKVGSIVRSHISDSSLTLKEMFVDEFYFIKKAGKVGILSSGLAFLIPC